MEKTQVIAALAALAHETRLDVFRLLVRTGMTGAAAGEIADTLGVPPATLSFHLAALSQAGLVGKRRESRNVIYAADFAAMNAMLAYLTENCCAGAALFEAAPAPDTQSTTQPPAQAPTQATPIAAGARARHR